MTKLLAVLTRYFKITFCCVGLLNITSAYADVIITDADRNLATQAKELRKQSLDVPVNIHSESAKVEALNVFKDIKRDVISQIVKDEPSKLDAKVLVFSSFSLGQGGLEDLSQLVSDATDATMIFQGLVDEKDLPGSLAKIQKLAATQRPVTNIALDPTLFQKHNVTHVPTIIMLGDDGEVVARVSGISDPGWLKRKYKEGNIGDLGVKGPVETILERNLIEVMQEKVAGIDWAEKKEEAIKRFWKKQKFIQLTRATQPRTRYLDPSILITDDMVTPNGVVIHSKGTRINPLDIKSFEQALVIFDPMDKKQLALVDAELKILKTKHQRITLMVTQFDRDKGWDSYKSITDHFDSPVFKLTNDVSSRFEIENVPTIVTAEDKHFVIKELALEEEEE